jgi:O-antigen/teichoic acid export membrane protein
MTATGKDEQPVLSGAIGSKRVLRQLAVIAMRGGSTVSKFLLAIYTARYLGLADLGIYGLLASAATMVPAVLGFGMTEWLMRKIVDLPRAEALHLIASRLSMILLLHLILWPPAFGLDILLGEPLPLRIAALSAAILLLENLGVEAADMLIARRRVLLAYWLTFLRTGFWPIPVMAIGLLYPETRTLESLLLGWLGMLIVSALIVAALAIPEGRWRHLRPRLVPLLRNLPGSFALYVKDVSSMVSLFLDRFLISVFVGLELTGVYTLYWSIANVAHSLTVYGLLQAQLPQMVAAAQTRDPGKFLALERHLQFETVVWSLLLAVAAAIVTPFLLPYLHQPLLDDYLPLFWVILLATLLRIAADGYGFALLALHRDNAIALVAVAGGGVSAVLNLVLTPLAGLWGAATAYVLTSGGLFAARYALSRPAIAAFSLGRAASRPARSAQTVRSQPRKGSVATADEGD